MLEFVEGWDAEDNNNEPNRPDKDGLRALIEDAMQRLKKRTQDSEFTYLVTHVFGKSELTKAKVVKGMHQEGGSTILPGTHCTLEVPEYPWPKRYHLFFLFCIMNNKKGWHPEKVSYEYEAKKYKEVTIL